MRAMSGQSGVAAEHSVAEDQAAAFVALVAAGVGFATAAGLSALARLPVLVALIGFRDFGARRKPGKPDEPSVEFNDPDPEPVLVEVRSHLSEARLTLLTRKR